MGWGTEYRVCAWDLLKEVTIIVITFIIVGLRSHNGENTDPPINRKLG